MTEATQTAQTTDAREASQSRVTTLDDIIQKHATQGAAKEPEQVEKPASEQPNDGESKPKKTAQERIQELVERSKTAEAKATAEQQRAAELQAQLDALTAQAKPLDAGQKPIRSQFTSDDEFIEALADFKAKEAARLVAEHIEADLEKFRRSLAA